MSSRALTDRLASLSPAQRALLEQALRRKEGAASPDAPEPRPAAVRPAPPAVHPNVVPKREQHSPAPLSIDQERLWFVQQLNPESPVYNIYNAIRFRGPLDLGLLNAAFREVVRRQDVLRTTFPLIDGRPMQVIWPHVDVHLPEVDLRGLPEELREAEAERAAEAVVRRPFVLDRLPLFNFPLIRIDDEDVVQPSMFHHIIVDRLSAEIMTVEVRALYGSLLQGLPSPLPELEVQFADFAVWQRRRLEDEGLLASHLAWWKERLAGAPELLPMPLDRPRGPVQKPNGARRPLKLSKPHSDGLRALALAESSTLFIAGLAALKALLLRWTNNDRIVVGTPFDYRQGPQLEPLLGFFLNHLVLYTDLSGNPTFREALGRVRETALGAYAHHELPFARLIEELNPERDLSRMPYGQVVFLLLPIPAHATPGIEQGRADVDQVAMDSFWVDARRTQFDINFGLWEEEDGRIAGFIEHSTDLFDETTIERMRELFRSLLATVLQEPDRPLWDVPLLSEPQVQQLVHEWNPREAADEGEVFCLHRRFEEQARRAPDAPALSFEDATLSYGELDRAANRLAHRLLAAGVAPGSRVGLCAGRGLGQVAGILAILKAGCAYVPLDPDYPQERLAYLLQDSGVAVTLAEDGTPLRPSPLGGGGLGQGGGQEGGVLWIEPAPLLTSPLPQPPPPRGEEPDTSPAVPSDPSAPAYVIYTSGSTGRPKGVVVTHRNVARLLTSTERWFGFGPTDVWTLFHSYAFDFSVWEIWGALAYGGRLVVVPYWVSRSPEVFHALLAREGVTVLNQTPSAFRQLVALENVAPLRALRWVCFGGEALEPGSLIPWWERYGDERPGLVNLYGITETTVHATFRRLRQEDSEPGRGSRIGIPLPDLAIHVLDRAGRPAPIGVSGEIHVAGEGLALGYLGRPELTAERFVPDAFGTEPGGRLYRSGDLARRVAVGELEYQGRIDHQVKIRGFRIELGEIEAALGQHSGVREGVVVARGGGLGSGDARLVAYLVPAGEAPPVEELRNHLRERLPEHMVPAVFVSLEKLPLTPTGKVDRQALPEPGEDRPELATEYTAPRDPVEEALCRVWAEVLRVERVGVHDNFFALGGDSILSLRVLAETGKLGYRLSLPDLFRYQTVAGLAAQVREGAGEAEPAALRTAPFSLVSEEDRARLPEDVVDAYPLAALQAGMMYHMVLRPEDPPYHNVDSWHLGGPFELEPFQEAVNRVVRRHPILRTSFDLTSYGEPLQIVHREADLPVVFSDIRHLSEEEQEAAVDALCAREKTRLHDFTRPPQLRIHVQLRSGGTFQFTLTENHAIFDGWSLHDTLAELFGVYLDLLDGKAVPEPPPVPLTYRDFVALERQAIESPEAAAYWEGALGDRVASPLPHWPSWPKPEIWPRIRGSVVPVSRASFHGLKALARTAEVPFKSVLLAAHVAAQARLAGSADVVTGIVSNGRMEEAGGDQVRGLFLNTVPLRVRLPEGSWTDLVQATARAEREMLPYRRVPFAALQRRFGGDRGDRPLFEMPFNYIHFHAVRDLLRTGRIEMIEFKRAEGSNFPITANFSQALEEVEVGCELEYDSRQWSREEVAAIGALYGRIVAAMAREPEAAYLEAPLLAEGERHQLVCEWNDFATVREAVPVGELIAAQAARVPEAVAMEMGEVRLTYGEMVRRAGEVAAELRELGVGPEVRVAIFLERSPMWLVAILGVWQAGGAYVPLDPAYPDARLELMLGDCGAEVLITEASLEGRLDAGEVKTLRLEVEPTSAAGPVTAPYPARRHARDPLGAAPPAAPPAPQRAAYVIYTSGSTGTPKGVVVEHGTLSRVLQTHVERFELRSGDRTSVFAALSFDASLQDLFGPLLVGATGVMFERKPTLDVERVVKRLGELTLIHGVPSLMRPLVQAARRGGPWPGMRSVLLGGEAIPADLLGELREVFPNARIHLLYGPTEATIICCLDEWEEGRESLPAPPPAGSPVGRPIEDAELLVLDGHRQPAPIGVAGEAYVGGGVLARGYLGRPELTAERFPVIRGRRWYRTGDLMRRLPDGRLEFLGRVDAQVKVRGFRIEPGEIEAVLRRHAAVAEAAVVARAGVSGIEGSRLVAYVVGTGLSVSELRAFLKDRLPDYMVPSAFVFLDALPLSPAGKVDRLALSRLEVGTRPEEGGTLYEAPRSPVEEAVAGLWAEVLGVPRIGRRDDFFESGGDSLLATRVMSRMRSAFGVEVPLAALFAQPTLAGLGAVVEAALRAGAGTAAPPLGPRPERGAPAPLSFAQQRLWFLGRMEPGSTAYNMPLAVRLQGELDEAALERALAEIVRRHEALRTVFAETPGGPVQMVGPVGDFRLPRVDLAGLGSRAEAEAQRLADEDAVFPFDLERGPLFRPVLVRIADGDAVLLGGMHHIVSDGWSTGLLLGELAALYGACREGRPSPLSELPVQYADFAVWQRRWLSGEVLEAELGYWREHLQGLPARLELPFDRPRPAVRRGRGATRGRTFRPETATAVRALAREEGVTLFMALLAAVEAFLGRLAEQEDFGLGTPIAGRNRLETEGLIGFFVNTLVLRSGVSGDPSFLELVGRARAETLAAYAHQDLPFEKLVEELAPERSLAHTPLFQVLFVLQNAGPESRGAGLPGLTLSPFAAEETHAKFDLTLGFTETPAGLMAGAEYDRDLFDENTIDRWLSYLETLTATAAASPGRRLSELPLLTAAEREQILTEWNQNDGEYPRERGLAELFEEQARNRPEAPALSWGTATWTYADLNAAADALAVRLWMSGASPETRIAVCLPRSPELVIAVLAVLKAGGAYVPLDPGHPADRLTWILEDAEAAILLTTPDGPFQNPGKPERPSPLGGGGWDRGEDRRGAGPLSAIQVIHVEEAAPLLSSPRLQPTPSPGGGTHGEPVRSGDALAYLIYTSGSTGRPKGVAVPQRAVVRLVRNTDYVQLTPEDRIALASNPAFDASTFEIWGALLNGACLVGLDREDLLAPHRLTAALRDQQVTALFLTTALFQQTVREIPDAFNTLRHLLFGGEASDPRRVREALAAGPLERLLHVYGPTETTTFASWYEVREPPEGAPYVPIGGPLRNGRLHVLNRAFEPVPFGVPGELLIGGDGLARGYHGRPDWTAERFVPDPFAPTDGPGARLYRTGDRVRRRPDGALEILGRLDRQVKIRGFRIEPGEIEAALAEHPAVREAAVIVRQDLSGEARLLAYVATSEESLYAADLRRHLAGHLPDFLLPSRIVPLPALPLTATGKVDRNALAAREDRAEEASRPAGAAPRDPVEETVAAIWAEVLGRESVGIHDDFFELGGHSLMATQVMSRLRSTLGIEMELRALFEAPTVAGLAAAVGRELRGAGLPPTPPVTRSREAGPAPLSFAQQRLWFLDKLEPESTAYNVPMAVRLRGDLDRTALAASLGKIAARHDTLRTTFGEQDGQPVQIVAPATALDLPGIDLSGLSAETAEAEAGRLAAEIGSRRLDLARGPLFQPFLLRLAPADHALVVALHHIVSDGWSIGVFVRELGEVYPAFQTGRPSPLAPLPVQYADFARWQREVLEGERLEAELGYWREHLRGLPPQLDLVDRPRPAVRLGRAAYHVFDLGAEETAALRRLARQEGATLFMTLLAGFEALLARRAGQEGFGVGTPIAGRNRVEIEGLIGFFVNTLVLRADLREDPGFRDLLARVRRETLAAYAHQDLPFEKLVEELAPERSLAYTPLFQVMFILQNAPLGALTLPGLELEPFPLEGADAKFDLTLSVIEAGEELNASLEYDRDLFEPETVERLAVQLRRLWAGAAASPDLPLSELPLLSEEERRQVVLTGEPPRQHPALIPARFAAQAAATPDAVALVAGEERWTYRELAARANAVAARLRDLGVGPEVRVGVLSHRTPALVAGLLGVLRAGGAYVPLDPTYPKDRLAWIVEDAQPSVLLTDAAGGALSREAGEGWGGGLPTVPLDLEPSTESIPDPNLDPAHLAYLIYTSGSTGRPKAVAVTHGGAAARIDWAGSAYSPEELGGVLAGTSINFDLSVFELFAPLCHGGRVILAADALELPRLAAASEVTLVNTVPSVMAELVRSGGVPAGVRAVNLAGEALSRELAEAILSLSSHPRLVNLYGPSEDTTYSTGAEVRPVGEKAPAIGRPLPGTRAVVLDLWGMPAPAGVPGELCLGGAGLARGYLGRPDLTAERWIPDALSGEPGARLYRTRDRARLNPDGDLEFLGRLDHQVKVRGFRVEPGEIEAALLAHPAVREAAVVVAGERLAAAVVGEGSSAPVLRAWLRERLPEPLVPSQFLVLDALPRTATGKLDRPAVARLAADPAAPQARNEAAVTVLSPAEELLAGIWSEVLRLPAVRIGPQDNFFDLSGHSLLAAQVAQRVRQTFGVDLPLRRLFERATLADLAREVEAAGAGEADALPPLTMAPRDGLLPAGVYQEWAWRLQGGPVGNELNMPLALRLQGPLEVPVLRRALTEIARRHEALRSSMQEVDGEILVAVAPPGEVPLPLVDLSSLPEELREAEARRITTEDTLRFFDLTRGPLWAVRLLQMGPEDRVFLLNQHHSISDGWSVEIFQREVEALYRAFHEGRPSPLPDLALQYPDFGAWQHRLLAGGALAGQLGWWRRRLEGRPPVFSLPGDLPRPAGEIGNAARLSYLTLSEEVTRQVREAARAAGCTLPMALFAALAGLMHRYTGETDLVLGAVSAGRIRPELAAMLGVFMNNLPVRLDLGGKPTFRDLLLRTREEFLATYAHQDLPLPRLLEKLLPGVPTSRTMLFRILFNLLSFPVDAETRAGEGSGIPGLRIELITRESARTRYDLEINFFEGKSTVHARFKAAAELISAIGLGALILDYESLLAQAVADLDTPLDRLLPAPRHRPILELNE